MKKLTLEKTNYIPSRKEYDNRTLPKFYFTIDYTIKNSVLCLKGDKYDTYHYNFDRLFDLYNKEILSLSNDNTLDNDKPF